MTFLECVPILQRGCVIKRAKWEWSYSRWWAFLKLADDNNTLLYDNDPYMLTLEDLTANDWQVVMGYHSVCKTWEDYWRKVDGG